MNPYKFLGLGLTLVALAACSDDDGVVDPVQEEPKALVRFINAVPDTGIVDFRFTDRLENLPTFLGVGFRASSGVYQRVGVGTRTVRVFVNSSDPVAAQRMLIDTTIVLTAGSRYTFVYAGRARGNADRLAVIDDDATLPTPAGIAVRTLHAAVGTGAVDVYVANSGSADPIAAKVGQFTNVAYLAKSAYTNLPVRSGAGALYMFGVANTGGATALFSATPNQPGIPTPAGQLTSPQPGVQIAGSVLTAVVFPGATAGSPAATATNQTPTVVLFIDQAIQ
jgi:uncharacterized protein DUF4397